VLGYWIDFSFDFTFSGIIRDIAKDRACFGLGVEMGIGLGLVLSLGPGFSLGL
jgi:hypothetical protein